jgi:hypothetical protein
MSLVETLAEHSGIYHGTGDGPESGPFVCRIDIGRLPNGGVTIDYETTSREQGVQHREHTMLVAGPDGRDRLYVAHTESPFVTEMVAADPGASRFVQLHPFGPYAMEIVIDVPEPERITYAWWWAPTGGTPTEQSKADVSRTH